MKITSILLVIALVFPFMGCDKLTMDDPKVAELEEKIAQLEAANTRLQDEKEVLRKQRDKLISENQTLIAGNKVLKEDLVTVLDAATYYERVVDEVVPESVDSIYRIDFGHNQLYNKPASRQVAQEIMKLIDKHGKDVKIKIEAYSSKAGSEEINKWFAKERADGVMHKIYEAYNSGQLNIELVAHGETEDNERKVIVTVEVP